jgi:hypothetical protein
MHFIKKDGQVGIRMLSVYNMQQEKHTAKSKALINKYEI